MPEVIALVSKSTRLLISLHNEDCNFKITDDRTTLLFDPAVCEVPLSNIRLQLSNVDDRKLIQSYNFPCHDGGRINSVRIDAIYSSVFGNSEPIESTFIGYPSFLKTSTCATYGLRVKLNFHGEPEYPRLSPINSVALIFDAATISVSKEMLALHSEFFLNFFYGDYTEKNSGSFRIKEVDDEEFNWFIDALIDREYKWYTAVDRGLAVLLLADRFCLPKLVKRMLPYIVGSNLDENSDDRIAALKRYIDLATRCTDNGDIMFWIFDNCKSSLEVEEVAMSCGNALTPYKEIYFRVRSLRQLYEKRKAEELRMQLPYQIFVKMLNGTTRAFQVSGVTTVVEVKNAIEIKDGIPTNEQRLIFTGKQLLDHEKLWDYKIYANSTIHLMGRLR